MQTASRTYFVLALHSTSEHLIKSSSDSLASILRTPGKLLFSYFQSCFLNFIRVLPLRRTIERRASIRSRKARPWQSLSRLLTRWSVHTNFSSLLNHEKLYKVSFNPKFCINWALGWVPKSLWWGDFRCWRFCKFALGRNPSTVDFMESNGKLCRARFIFRCAAGCLSWLESKAFYKIIQKKKRKKKKENVFRKAFERTSGQEAVIPNPRGSNLLPLVRFQ